MGDLGLGVFSFQSRQEVSGEGPKKKIRPPGGPGLDYAMATKTGGGLLRPRSGISDGSVEEGRRPDPGRRTAARSDLRAAGAALPSESEAGPECDSGRSGAAVDGAQARAELELRSSGARGQSQPGVSDVHAHRDRNGARRQDPGKVGTSPGEQNRGADSSATGGDCRSTSCGGREKDAPRYNGNGSEHSLSNRQQSVGGWDAGADPDHEADQRPGRRARDTIAGSAANDRIPGNGNCPAQPVQGSGAEKEDAGEIPGVGALDATGTEPGAAVLGGDPQRSEACGESETASGTWGEETGVGCDDSDSPHASLRCGSPPRT